MGIKQLRLSRMIGRQTSIRVKLDLTREVSVSAAWGEANGPFIPPFPTLLCRFPTSFCYCLEGERQGNDAFSPNLHFLLMKLLW